MVSQIKIVALLNNTLNINKIKDSSINGLQVDSGNKNIKKIGFAVDACLDSFKKARSNGCDLLIVHHGLFWDPGIKAVTGNIGARIRYLMQNNISLYAAHLPLDVHPKLGNNAYLKAILNIKKIKYFGPYNGNLVSIYSAIRPTPIRQIAKRFESALNTKAKLICFGPEKSSKIAICSGGGTYALNFCKELGIDTLITGEMKHGYYHIAKEDKVNVIYAGHYATECGGLLNLQDFIKKKLKINTVFIDSPTGL